MVEIMRFFLYAPHFLISSTLIKNCMKRSVKSKENLSLPKFSGKASLI